MLPRALPVKGYDMTMKLEKILIYPVKSMAGYEADSAYCDKDGLEGDRRFVVTKPGGQFLTAREYPKLLTLSPRWIDEGEALVIDGDRSSLTVRTTPSRLENSVTVWDDTVTAGDCGDEVAVWLSDFLGREVRLKAIGDEGKRRSAKNPLAPDSFADAMPLLLLSDASVADINSRLKEPVSYRNFRPNLLISGVPTSFEEDLWSTVKVGDMSLEMVYACSRCIMTTADPSLGVFRKDKEPIKTLGTYRRGDDKQIYVGQNAIVQSAGVFKAGDLVTVSSRRERNIYHLA